MVNPAIDHKLTNLRKKKKVHACYIMYIRINIVYTGLVVIASRKMYLEFHHFQP